MRDRPNRTPRLLGNLAFFAVKFFKGGGGGGGGGGGAGSEYEFDNIFLTGVELTDILLERANCD